MVPEHNAYVIKITYGLCSNHNAANKKSEDGEGGEKAGERADILIFHNQSADPAHSGDLVKTGLTDSKLFMFFLTSLGNLRRLF